MKKIFTFFAAAWIVLAAQAQLKVVNSGDVVVGDTTAISGAQLTSFKFADGEVIGVLGIARANNVSRPSGGGIGGSLLFNIGHAYGVKGLAGGGSTQYNYGVFGQLQNGAHGAAVAGYLTTPTNSVTLSNQRLAGLFGGPVYVSGTITSTGYNAESSAQMMSEVSDINNDAVSSIMSLTPVQFRWNHEQYATLTGESNEVVSEILDKNLHYGLVAQDVREFFPDLVYGNEENGTLSINYTELIPLLIQSVKDLSQQVQELRGGEMKKAPAFGDEMPAVLYQNNPNPFSEATVIAYQLPASVCTATIYVYDMSGNQLAAYPLQERGEARLTISAGELGAGMYLYSLIADGQVVDTKRMIITK